MFIHFDRIHERDTHTHTHTPTHTPHDDIGRACITSRGNRILTDAKHYNWMHAVKIEVSHDHIHAYAYV